MELIDKSAVIAEIERRISNHNKELQHASDEDFVSSWASDEENQKLALTALIPFLNTLEVKEVGLDKHPSHTWIEKACKWLDENMEDHTRFYEYCDVHSAEPTEYDFKKDFVEAFKKAMEEQQ